MISRSPQKSRDQAEQQVLVSVVTIALNAARDLPLTIESVAGQNFADFEYVVVDGGSWDSSFDIYGRYADRIDRLLEVEDAGVYSAMNFAASQCRGRYVIFMNAGDCFYSASALSNIFAAIGDDRPDVIHGDHVYVDKGLELHKRSVDFTVTRRVLLEGSLSNTWHDRFPCHQATLTSRELLARLGGYDTRYDICADHDFLLRAAESGASMRYVDETVAHYFGGGMSAQRGERCGIEWIEIYRSRSRHPQAVDRYFNAERLVRHDTQSATTGVKISGFLPTEGPSPDQGRNFRYSWGAGDGFSVVTPRMFESLSLTIQGENPGEQQVLTLSSGGAMLGTLTVPAGPFLATATFCDLLPPGSLVEVFPSTGMTIAENRFVSLLIKEFLFQPPAVTDAEPLALGQGYDFSAELRSRLQPLLRSGWSGIEPAHVWSVGRASHLLLPAEEPVRELTLTLSGNPFVDERSRKADLSLNGQTLGAKIVLPTSKLTLAFKVPPGVWRHDGGNLLTFRPERTAEPPNDSRELGVCLHSIRLD